MATINLSVATDTLLDQGKDLLLEEDLAPLTPWQVLVWDDPINLMSFVTYVFRQQFGYSAAKAQQLMLQVHTEGKAVVFSGSKEEAERHTQALQAWGLWATLEEAGA